MEVLEYIWTAARVIATIYGTAFLIGCGWQVGRNTANKTQHVCDVCFRNIKKINEALKEK